MLTVVLEEQADSLVVDKVVEAMVAEAVEVVSLVFSGIMQIITLTLSSLLVVLVVVLMTLLVVVTVVVQKDLEDRTVVEPVVVEHNLQVDLVLVEDNLDLHSKVEQVLPVAVVDTTVVEVVNMWVDVVLMVPVVVDQDIFHQLISKRVHLVEKAQRVVATHPQMDHSRLIEYQLSNRS